MKTTTEKKSMPIIFKENEFLVNPTLDIDRTGDYLLRDLIKKDWEYYGGEWLENSNGNVHNECVFSMHKQTFVFMNYEQKKKAKIEFDSEEVISMYKVISAPLMLYRLIATFFGAPDCFDGYKNIWSYTLKHKSGKKITFAEWKGAVGFWLEDYTHTSLKTDFKQDLISLLNYLVSNECAHPYDSLCAGSVA